MAALVLLKSMIFATALRKDKKKKRTESERQSDCIGRYPCRICNQAQARVPIFDNKWKRNIAEEIKSFSSVIVSTEDSHPKHICQQCLDLLNSCILFRNTCQQTQHLFNEQPLVQVHLETGNNDTIDTSNSDYDPCKDGGSTSGDDFSNMLETQLSQEENIQEKHTCAECFQEYADKQSYTWHLPFCEARHIEKRKSIKKESGKRRQKADKGAEKTKLTYLCDTCGKTCCNKHVLASHMTTHTNVFPFKCDACPYRGRTADLLRTHQRSHLADKPYKCSLCPKTTTTCSNLRRHEMTRHGAPGNHVKCTYCDKSFTNKIGLKKHINNIHLRQAGGYECDICFRKYSTQKILNGHRYKVHKVARALLGRLPAYLLHAPEGEE